MFHTVRASLLLLLAVPALAIEPPDGDWKQFEVDGIELFTDAGEGRATEIARQIGALRRSLNVVAMVDTEWGRQVRLFVFKNRESLAPYVPMYQGKPRSVAGYTTQNDEAVLMAVQAHYRRPPNATGYDGWLTPFEVISHEYVHAFLAERAPQTPLWLNEGLAEFFSTYRLDDGMVYIGEPAYRHVHFLDEQSRGLSLARILMLKQDDPEYNEGKRTGFVYAQSWATTHYMMTDKQRRGALKQFMRDIHDGMPEMAAVNRDLLEYLPNQGPQLREYATQDHLPYFRLKAQDEDERGKVVKIDVDEATLFLRFGELVTGLGPDSYASAREHFQACLQRDPDRAEARIGLARLAIYQSDFDAAVAELETALARTPDHPGINGMLGYTLIEQHHESLGAEAWSPENTRSEIVVRARSLLEQSRTGERPQAWSNYALAMSYLGEEDPTPGIEALEEAIRIAPWNAEFFDLLVWLHCKAGDLTAARQVYENELRTRTRIAERRDTESHLVGQELVAAAKLKADGRDSEAAMMLIGALETTESKPSRQAIADQALRLGLDGVYRQYIGVVRLSQSGRFQEALTELESIQPIADPELRERAEVMQSGLEALVAAALSR